MQQSSPATALPPSRPSTTTVRAASIDGDLLMTVLPENLPDFGRWPSEDEVHERAEEGRSKDTGASDYNIEKAWKQTIEVLGFEDFKEDLAALLEMGFEVEAATDALLACHDLVTSGADGNASSRPLEQAIEMLMMNNGIATFGSSHDSTDDEEDFLLDSASSSPSGSESDIDNGGSSNLRRTIRRNPPNTTPQILKPAARPPLLNQPLRLAWGSDRQRQSAAALCAAVEDALLTRSMGADLPTWASPLLAAAERGRQLAELLSRTGSNENTGGGHGSQRAAMQEAALTFALADLTRPNHGVATALRRPAALQLAVVLAHEAAMAQEEREEERVGRQAEEARNPLGAFDHAADDDEGVSGGGAPSAQEEAKGSDCRGRRGGKAEDGHDTVAAAAWRRAELAVHRSVVISGPGGIPSWMANQRKAADSEADAVNAQRAVVTDSSSNSILEATGGRVSGGETSGEHHTTGGSRPLTTAEKRPGVLRAGVELAFQPISGFAYPLACHSGARVIFLDAKAGMRAAQVMWASGFTFWVYWQDLRTTHDTKLPSATGAGSEVINDDNNVNVNEEDLTSAHAAVVAAAKAAVGARQAISASSSPNAGAMVRSNSLLHNKWTNHSTSSSSCSSSNSGKGLTFESRAAEPTRCAVCWDDLTAPLNDQNRTSFPAFTTHASQGNDMNDDITRMLEEGRAAGTPSQNAATEVAGGTADSVPSNDAAVVLERSSAVPIPGCGHTLCAECIYSWLKSNISSGKLTGAAMRCPLANVSSANGGHEAPPPPSLQAQRRNWGGRPDRRRRRQLGDAGNNRSDAFNYDSSAAEPTGGAAVEAARELSPQEVETLIMLTAEVGEVVDAETIAQEAARVETARLKALKAVEDAARAAEMAKVEEVRNTARRERNEADVERAVALAHVTCPEGHVLVGCQGNVMDVRCDGFLQLASFEYDRNGKNLSREEFAALSTGCIGFRMGMQKEQKKSCALFACRACNYDVCSSCALAIARSTDSAVGEFLSISGASDALSASKASLGEKRETLSPRWLCLTSKAGASLALSTSLPNFPCNADFGSDNGGGGNENVGWNRGSNRNIIGNSRSAAEYNEQSPEPFTVTLNGNEFLELVVPTGGESALASMLALLEAENTPDDEQSKELATVTAASTRATSATSPTLSAASTKAREANTVLTSVLPPMAVRALEKGSPVVLHLPARRVAWPLPPQDHYESSLRSNYRGNRSLSSGEIVEVSGSNEKASNSNEISEINDNNFVLETWYPEEWGGLSPSEVGAELQRFVAAIHKREREANERHAAIVAECEEAVSTAAAAAAATKDVDPPVEAAASAPTADAGPQNTQEIAESKESGPSAQAPLSSASKTTLPPLLVKYRKFLANRDAETKPGMRWCPTPGCETALVPTLHSKTKKVKQKKPPRGSGEADTGASPSDVELAEGAPQGRGGPIQKLLLMPLRRLNIFAKAFTSSSSGTPTTAVMVVSGDTSNGENGSSRRLRSTSRNDESFRQRRRRRRKQGREDCWRVVCCAAQCSLRTVRSAVRAMAMSAAVATGADLIASRTMPAPELTCPSCAADVCSRCGRPAHRYTTTNSAATATSDDANHGIGNGSGSSGRDGSSDNISGAHSSSASSSSSSTKRNQRWLTYLARSGCEEAVDETLAAYRKEKHLQPCPACCRQVEKIDACPHMSCPCGHQWCWVCRGNFPCANLHFGKSGQGSSEEIGDVTGVQRLAVGARMVSLCACPPLAAALTAFAALAWAVACGGSTLVLSLALCVKSCASCARWKAARVKRVSLARGDGGSSGGSGGPVLITINDSGQFPTSKDSTEVVQSAGQSAATLGRSSCFASSFCCSTSEICSYARMTAFATSAEELVRSLPTHDAAKALNAAVTGLFVLFMLALALTAAVGTLVIVHLAAVVLLPCTLAYLSAALVSATKAAAQDRLADALLHNRSTANPAAATNSLAHPTPTNSSNTRGISSASTSNGLLNNLAASTTSTTTVTETPAMAHPFPTPRSPSFAPNGPAASSASTWRAISLDLEVFDVSHGLQDALWPKVPSSLDQAYATWNRDVAKATTAYVEHERTATTATTTPAPQARRSQSSQVSDTGLELGTSGGFSSNNADGDGTSTSSSQVSALEAGSAVHGETALHESRLVKWANQHAALGRPTAPLHPDLRLPQRLVRWGRAGCATACVACFFAPGIALALLASPFAPCLLLPLLAQPRGPLPRHWAPMFAPLVGLLSLALAAWGLPSILEAISTGGTSHDRSAVIALALWLRPGSSPLGWFPAGAAAVCGWAAAFLLLRRPALSNCACCAPAWFGAYSFPLALLVGRTKARTLLAFSPVPDLALQLPMILVLLAMGVID